MINDFSELIHIQFLMIYPDGMSYEKSKTGLYCKMILNYVKQSSSGKEVYTSKNK